MRFYYRDLIELTGLSPVTILNNMRKSLMKEKSTPSLQFFLDEDLVPYTTYQELRNWLGKKAACRAYLNLVEEDPLEIKSICKLMELTGLSDRTICNLKNRGYFSLPATASEIKNKLKKHPDVKMLLEIYWRSQE